MFVTDNLRRNVQKILLDMEERSDFLLSVREDEPFWAENRERRWAAERAVYVAVECVTDVANLVIDTLVMRDPGNYEDMLRVLFEEHVVTKEWFDEFVSILDFRSRLVRDYGHLSPDDVGQAVHKYAPLFGEYARSLRTYLEIEG